MKKKLTWRRSLMTAILIISLLITSLSPLALSASGQEHGGSDYETYLKDLSDLVTSTWEEDFFSSMMLMVDEPEMSIDGQSLPISEEEKVTPVVEGDTVLIPVEAAKKAVGESQGVILGESVKESGSLAAAVSSLKIEAEEDMIPLEALESYGLETNYNEENEQILISAPFQTKRLLVQTDGSAIDSCGASTVLSSPDDLVILQFESEEDARAADEKMERNPHVLFSEPDLVCSIDREYKGWGTTRIGADQYIDYLNTVPELHTVNVAVLDTGVDQTHPFLKNRASSKKKDFVFGKTTPVDGHGHGTHVSGIITDATDTNVKIMSVKVADDLGFGSSAISVEGIKWAVDNGAQVINISMGGLGSSQAYQSGIDYATKKNVSVIVSAGNEAADVALYTPANVSNAITVSSCGIDDVFSSFSNYGSFIDVCAPGEDINSSLPGGAYAEWSGTSMSAPYVSATAALLYSTDKLMTPAKVESTLRGKADDRGAKGWDPNFGSGVVNIKNCIPKTAPAVTGVFLNTAEKIVNRGKTYQLVATVNPTNADNRAVTWSSSNSAVAKVDGNGLVTAVKGGVVTITVTTKSGSKKATATIKVPSVDVSGVSLDKTKASILCDKTIQLTATVTPSNATYPSVRWSTSDSSIATVSQSGQVTAKKVGDATITVTTTDGGKKASCAVTVLPVAVTGISVDKKTWDGYVGAQVTLKAYFSPVNATNQSLKWTSSNTQIASVDSKGLVTLKEKGTAKITATSVDGGYKDSCAVTVKAAVLTKAFTSISGSNDHSIALRSDGTVWGWGSSSFGGLGNGTEKDRPYLSQAVYASGAPLTNVKKAVASNCRGFALLDNGTLWGWGYNGKYAGDDGSPFLGDGTLTTRLNPVQVKKNKTTPLTGVQDIYAGQTHLIIKMNDNTLWALGLNWEGTLGDGTTQKRYYPVRIMSDAKTPLDSSTVEDIQAGLGFTILLKKDGSVWSWGTNYQSELGDGTTKSRSYPVRVMADNKKPFTGVEKIFVGERATFAIKKDGSVWGWGFLSEHHDIWGSVAYPMQIMSDEHTPLSNISKISNGEAHTVFLKKDGTAWAMGWNYYGPLATGNNKDAAYPVPIKYDATTSATDIQEVYAFGNRTFVLKKDGTLWGAGFNAAYGLGNGTRRDSTYLKQAFFNEKSHLKLSLSDKPVKTLSLSQTLTVSPGQSIQLNPTIQPIDASNTRLTWSSSNTKIATVDQTGKVTGKTAGKVTITAKAASGVKATCQTTVLTPSYVTMKIGSQKAIQNGKKTTIDNAGTKPYIASGRTMLPLRFVSEKMGGTVKYVSDSEPIVLTYGDKKVEIRLNSKSMKVISGSSSKTVELDVAAQKRGGKTYIPLRAIGQALGFDVYYDSGQKFVIIRNVKMTEAERKNYINEAKKYF